MDLVPKHGSGQILVCGESFLVPLPTSMIVGERVRGVKDLWNLVPKQLLKTPWRVFRTETCLDFNTWVFRLWVAGLSADLGRLVF